MFHTYTFAAQRTVVKARGSPMLLISMTMVEQAVEALKDPGASICDLFYLPGWFSVEGCVKE